MQQEKNKIKAFQQIGKQKVKQSSCTDDLILYVELSMESIHTQTKTRCDKQVYEVHKIQQVQYTRYRLYFYTLARNMLVLLLSFLFGNESKRTFAFKNKTNMNKIIRNSL